MKIQDHVSTQSKTTLNMILLSHIHQQLFDQLHIKQQFEYTNNTTENRGTCVVAHVKFSDRLYWFTHDDPGFYIGTTLDHLHCHNLYINKTTEEQVSVTVHFLPNLTIPYMPHRKETLCAAQYSSRFLLPQPFQTHTKHYFHNNLQ